MLVTILGSGTSVGVPMIGRINPWNKHPKNQRMRTSCLIEPFGRGGPAILIDTSPDLRQQVLQFFPKKNPRLDTVLITHEHADHLHGIDDIRPFNFIQKASIPFYAEDRVLKILKNRFSYIFNPVQVGGGIPKVSLHSVSNKKFRLTEASDPRLKKFEVEPLPLNHGKITTLGYRMGPFAYLTDFHEIPEARFSRLEGLDLLVMSCLRPKPHPTHVHIELAFEYARRINAKRTIFTHLGTEIEYEAFEKTLPPRCRPAYDGRQLRVAWK